jgi:hypothetical protein
VARLGVVADVCPVPGIKRWHCSAYLKDYYEQTKKINSYNAQRISQMAAFTATAKKRAAFN